MAFNLITDDFKVHQVEQMLESFSEDEKSFYYMFFGRHVPWPGGVVPEVDTSKNTLDISSYNHMQFAKRIMPDDVAPTILRHDWTSGRIYSQYDHRADDLNRESFYVGVMEGTNYNVFKCLSNNNGAVSTVAPSFTAFSNIETADTETYDGYYETSDGYQWKYMFTVTEADLAKFATSRFIPVFANTEVSDFAVSGSIDVVNIENGGVGYDNFFYGEFISNSDIAYMGNTTYFAIRSKGEVSPSIIEDFYNGCIFKITSGRGAGQYREVLDYVNSGGARYAVLDNAFSILPDTTSTFEITPKVEITGTYVDPAVGRAIMGVGNSISKVEILNRGRGYIHAEAVIKQSNVAVESNTAVLVPILPPRGGHGANAALELSAKWLTISVKVSGDENGMIPSGQKFGQVGILKDPKFANIELTTVKASNTAAPGRDGSFLEGEKVVVFNPIRQIPEVVINEGSNIVTLADPDDLPLNKLHYPGGRVFIKNMNANNWFTSEISSANSSALVLKTNSNLSDNNASIYISEVNTEAYHVSSGPSWQYVTNATPFFTRGDQIIGLQTFSTAVVTDIEISNKTVSDFEILNQLTIISIDDPIGTFTTDQFLSDVDGLNTCYFHSYANVNHMYVTGIVGNMDAGTVLRDPTASASITVANKYDGQILQESGSVIYLENHELVSRETSTVQTKKIIVEF